VATRKRTLAALVAAALVVAGAIAGTTAALGAASPMCTTPQLVVWLDTEGDGAAGSTYYHLELTNLSGHACTLRGFPGVSAVTLAGKPIGAPASRDPVTKVRTIPLVSGATASAVLRIVDALNFPASRCHLTTAAGLRVYPPGSRGSRIAPFPFSACSVSGSSVLSVGTVTAGPR
jgi:hypothetical protein